MKDQTYNTGIDIGSTTIKTVVTDNQQNVLFKEYRRHYADIENAILAILGKINEKFGNFQTTLCMTGSAGMGIAERCDIPFVQEVVSACDVISLKYPEIRVLVDIGGEDAKMIFFKDNQAPDIRMNGSCAGGTGSFIDQIASLLNIDISELNLLAQDAQVTYPIASRCGVFCKTDIQNLLSQNVSKADIAASVFHAVSIQVLTSLARGQDIQPNIMLCGGPFYFLPELRKSFAKTLKFNEDELIISEYSDVFPAWGAAINAKKQQNAKALSDIIQDIKASQKLKHIYDTNRLQSLFINDEDFQKWKNSKKQYYFEKRNPEDPFPKECFIGIDSGSTTTKLIALDKEGKVFFHSYQNNNGNSLKTITNSLITLYNLGVENGVELKILSSCATGYGEDLLKAALSIDFGIVETIAHYSAASHFNSDISFILDIGGQDMKAIFIKDGFIRRLEINEACSSGCGSFIETFAHSLNMTAPEFSDVAIQSQNPCDLGTRCTVFMNSKVKQALREGASVSDISAGLGFGVIRNCLNKVLKLRDYSDLGDNIMVQGGTFRNIAVLRSLELEVGKSVMITDYPELMGAYGTALFSKAQFESGAVGEAKLLSEMIKPTKTIEKVLICKGCENNCQVKSYKFENNNTYYAGNKCEKVFYSKGDKAKKGINLHTEKYDLLFNRNTEVETPKAIIGIPRALGIYENYPFWHKLFSDLQYKIVLSDVSTMKMFEKGIDTVMADNICFPAKLTNGHIVNLADKKTDRIFLPFVVFEKSEDKQTPNSFNCPIVTGYSEVIKSAINPERKFNIPIDSPSISFKDKKLLEKACFAYFKGLEPNISKSNFKSAFNSAMEAQKDYEQTLKLRCKEIAKKAEEENRLLMLLSSRPYHVDPLIQHKISSIISDFGVDIITEDIMRDTEPMIDNAQTIMQWAYTNRILKSAMFVAKSPNNLHYIELTSFGCGPDSFILDEVNDILARYGKNPTILKIDDINNTASTRLRIRSLIESLKFNHKVNTLTDTKAQITPLFTKDDIDRTILVPWFADFYSPFVPSLFEIIGYKIENLPPSNQESAEMGLRYSNNEVCYPATLVIGDLLKALRSGGYDLNKVAVGITQTGGQCRATNYTSLIKKGLIAAGFTNIPVISVGIGGNVFNEQPGFVIPWAKLYKYVIPLIVYADCLSRLYYSTAPRETEKGAADKIRNKYLDLGSQALRNMDTQAFYILIKEAAKEFTAINNGKDIPVVGIVGEIFVKYNSFSHKNVINWLVNNGVEPVIPALMNFFTDGFTNRDVRSEEFVEKSRIPNFLMDLAEKHINKIIAKMENKIKDFPFFRPIGYSREESHLAKDVINLNAQFGEGWRIAAEIAHFAKSGINNVISLQPFGCIANHIVSKGIEKRIREIYPKLNLLSLDFDSGMSEVNIYNRLHFIMKNAKTELNLRKLPTYKVSETV